MTKREISMLILSAHKIHCSDHQKSIRFRQNKAGYKLWLKKLGEKDSTNNKRIFRRSHHYKKTLILVEFAVKTLKVLPEIDFSAE